MSSPRRTRKQPGRILHISAFDTPEVPRYSDGLRSARNSDKDNEELARVLSKLENMLLLPRARMPALVLDALYLFSQVNRLEGLPFSEYTRTRHETDDHIQRYLRWFWREVERKRS